MAEETKKTSAEDELKALKQELADKNKALKQASDDLAKEKTASQNAKAELKKAQTAASTTEQENESLKTLLEDQKTELVNAQKEASKTSETGLITKVLPNGDTVTLKCKKIRCKIGHDHETLKLVDADNKVDMDALSKYLEEYPEGGAFVVVEKAD